MMQATFIAEEETELREQLEQRVAALKKEYERGLQLMRDLEAQQDNLRNTMLRLSGAIEVLEEELAAATAANANGGEGRTQTDDESFLQLQHDATGDAMLS
jgi:uncharacterized protein (DUF3084 family)